MGILVVREDARMDLNRFNPDCPSGFCLRFNLEPDFTLYRGVDGCNRIHRCERLTSPTQITG